MFMGAWQRLNPQLLRYFLAIAREGSLSAAGLYLSCVPSNVSARLRQLEQQLDARLFMRQGQRLRLTPAGERLLPHAEHLEQLCRTAWRSVQEDIWSGDLRLGAMETTAAVRLPELLAAFHQRAPRVNLQLSTGPSRRLIEGVLAGELDAGLVGGPFEHAQLECTPLWQEELMLVLPPAQDAAGLEGRAQTLLGFPEGCHYRERLERWAVSRGLQVAARQSYGSIDAIFAGIAAGMGIGLLPRSLLESHPRLHLVQYQPIAPELGATTTLLVRRRDAGEHPSLALLLELIRAQSPLNG
jgi:DNA-binding transcriptional LysR family regulator